jgi:signal transduction histidine kinase
MNLELSQLKLHFRSALGLDATTEAEDSISSSQRNLEAGFAIARALVVLSIPLTVRPSGDTDFLYSAVASYSLYAAALIFAIVTIRRQPAPFVIVAIHVADIVWVSVFAASIHSLGSVLLLLVFPMLTATLRWGTSATLATTLALVGVIEGSAGHARLGSSISDYLVTFQTSASVILLGILFAHVGKRHRQASRNAVAENRQDDLLSGTPAQIVQSIVDQAFDIFRPKYVQLLIEEEATGRSFLWHAEGRNEFPTSVRSEEFDHATADPHLRLLPDGDWLLDRTASSESPLIRPTGRKIRAKKENVPLAFSDHFGKYETVLSAAINMTSDWQGRIIVCDPSTGRSHQTSLAVLRQFCDNRAYAIHTAHLCLRACRATAAEERARLARELHDGVIQSLLGVDLRLETMKRQTGLLVQTHAEIQEMQGILRVEAMGLRQLVNDSRRRALRPERLVEYLSDLLERFQRDSGFMTHFFADLDNEPMPPRICHEIARITEEAVVNAKKHSGGSTLVVRIGCLDDNWLLVIIDDGVGFGFEGAFSLEKLMSSGLGPRVIQERVQLLGGDLLIESTPTGARIEITIPKNRTSSSDVFAQKRSIPVEA